MTTHTNRRPTGRRPRRPSPLVIGLLAVLAVAAITLVAFGLSPIGQRFLADADAAPPVTGVDVVPIVDSRFVPASIAVPVGAEVTWEWTDGEDHNVVFEDGPASPVQASGTWSRTFAEPGEHAYTCTLHAFMDGRVVVTR